MSESVSECVTEEGARRTEGRKEGPADAGGMPANKTRTPHRDVGKYVSAKSNHVKPDPLRCSFV